MIVRIWQKAIWMILLSLMPGCDSTSFRPAEVALSFYSKTGGKLTLPKETERAEIKLVHPDRETVTATFFLDENPDGGLLENILPGTDYSLSVSFLNPDDVLLVSGMKKDVFIQEGTVNRIEIPLERRYGDISVGFQDYDPILEESALENPSIAITIRDSEENPLIETTFTPNEPEIDLADIPSGSNRKISMLLIGAFADLPILLAEGNVEIETVLPDTHYQTNIAWKRSSGNLSIRVFVENAPAQFSVSSFIIELRTLSGDLLKRVTSPEAYLTVSDLPSGRMTLSALAQDEQGSIIAQSQSQQLILDAESSLELTIGLQIVNELILHHDKKHKRFTAR